MKLRKKKIITRLSKKFSQKYDEKAFAWFVKLDSKEKENILSNEELGNLLHDRIYHAYVEDKNGSEK